MRSRAALVAAARALFLEKGYAATTMEEIALRAGLTKRTVYNHYADKGALFTQIVESVIGYAEGFARALGQDLPTDLGSDDLPDALHELGRHLALGILRPEVIALRRLLVAESREFPELVEGYFDRAPGRVIAALASWFEHLTGTGVLRASDPERAAGQFAYLVVGEPLDRAILTGTPPTREHLLACARAAVETFLARYGAGSTV